MTGFICGWLSIHLEISPSIQLYQIEFILMNQFKVLFNWLMKKYKIDPMYTLYTILEED